CAQPILRPRLRRNTRRYPLRRMRDRSPVKWVERSKTEERGPTDSARQRRYAAQRSNTREVSRCISPARILPAQIPGRLTASGLVGSARIALPIHFAGQCGAFTTYRRLSFSLDSAIFGFIAATACNGPGSCCRQMWREQRAIVLQRLASIRVTLCPQPAVLRLWPTRETLAPHHARSPRRRSLRDGARRDRAYMATGGLHTFGRTRQRRRGCGGSRRAQDEVAARTRNPACRGNSRGIIQFRYQPT